ncbi:Uncharacterized protein APZ42_014892 [Daphnia magna]|uniref:Uncharacterized protein n=1 Tax=Daphnia magna TaxID=35525 RepID=A0A162NZ45_9CRUS|nr:Uncharacterized protein APZ42_014892 [Daphnia magna]
MSGFAKKQENAKFFSKCVDDLHITNICEKIDAEFPDPEPDYIPTPLNFGISLPNNIDIFQSADWWDLPPGIMCSNCYNQVPNTYPIQQQSERVCLSCKRENFPLKTRSNEFRMKKMRFPPITNLAVNHIAVIGRQSRGKCLKSDCFHALVKFTRCWQNFPHRNTMTQNLVGYFGGHGSALALHSTMTRHLIKNSKKETYEPFSYILPRLNCYYRPGIDKITIVFYTFSALTVKPSNLISFILDFVEIKIPPKDVIFVAYGDAFSNSSTIFSPIVLNGDKLLTTLINRESTAWLDSMKWGCYARMFPTTPGRNRGNNWLQNANNEISFEEYDEEIAMED